MQMYTDACTDNQVCKLFALTEGVVTWDMLTIPQEKLNKNIK